MINFVTQVVNPEKRLHSDLIALANCKRNNLASIDFCFRQLFTGSLGNTSLKITVFPEVKFVPVLKKSKTWLNHLVHRGDLCVGRGSNPQNRSVRSPPPLP